MKIYLILLLFLFNFSLSRTADASTHLQKIFPADDAMAQLYDDDGITDWSIARNFESNLFREPYTSGALDNIGNIVVRSDNAAGFYRIYRVSNVFDLRNLPPNVTITSARLKLYKSTGNNQGDVQVVVTSHERVNITFMQKQDWKITNFGTTEFSRTTLLDNQYTTFDFNPAGLTYLNNKLGQFATLGTLTNYDFDNVEPSGFIQAAGWYEVEKEGVDTDPYLEITYTTDDLPTNTFPLYTQIISPHPSLAATTEWADDILAAGKAGPYCRTIAQCGCTITSLVMLGRAHGITTGIDGSDVNPGNFNQWLIQHNGYNAAGLLDFSQAVKYFGVEENGIQKSYYKWTGNPLTEAQVKARVASGVPTVSSMVAFNRNGTKIPTHFVLVTEQLSEGMYGVRDPIWYNTLDLNDDVNRESYVQDYNDRISNGRNLTYTNIPTAIASRFSGTLVGKNNSVLTFNTFSALSLLETLPGLWKTAPADMKLLSPSGNELGVKTSEVYLRDPLAENYVAPIDSVKNLYADGLQSGAYKVVVTGSGDGAYQFSGLRHDSDGREHPFTFERQTARGMIHNYQFDVSSQEVLLLPLDKETLSKIMDNVAINGTENKFFKMWLEKIYGEIKAGHTLQAKQYIETLRILVKARKVDGAALLLALNQLEAQLQ